VRVAVGARSDVGRIRRGNEDSYLAEPPVFVVADGMGGHIAGDVASSTAVETIANHIGEASAADPQTLARLVHQANTAVWAKAQSDTSLSGMGTTCTVVYVDNQRAHVAHVGDSRAYRLRGGELERLTEDHTLVARMVREGRIRPEDAERHPQRSIITRALGVDPEISVDLTTVELGEGDRLLLCSDGLTSMIAEHDISDVLTREQDAQAAADSLVDLANDAGGEDNVTVVIIDLFENHGGSRGSSSNGAPDGAAARMRSDTSPGQPGIVHVRRRGGWTARVVTILVAVALLLTGGYAAARYSLDNSWFVSIDETNHIAIYNGIPEKIGGLEFKEKQEVASTTLNDLPRFLRSDVQDGIKVDSLEEARDTLDNLNQRAGEFATNNARDRRRKS